MYGAESWMHNQAEQKYNFRNNNNFAALKT